jgi:alkanesulfonate monooxygenase SsuD/methylene tetrahydromethanopterin reductase-like flavin-dependent oxidoreductase (luciferase family)
LVPPPLETAEAMATFCTPGERLGVDAALACAVVGSDATVRRGLREFVDRHRPDELLLTANIFDHAARRDSFERAMRAAAD